MTILSPKSLLYVLLGDHRQLYNAIHWHSTPQGYDHWHVRWHGRVPLTDDDWAYLIRLANERKCYVSASG